MTMESKDDPQELAGQYVLGTLSTPERFAVERALLTDAALRAALSEWEARLLPLTALAAPEEPSPQLWPRIAGSLAASRAGAGLRASGPAMGRWWGRLTFWRGLAGAGFAAAAIMLAVTLQLPGTPETRFMVVLAQPDNLSPGWVLQSSEAGRLRLVPLRPTVVPSERALQLWTKADGWTKPVSLGLVEPGKAVEVLLRDLPPLQPNQLFEITLEPPAGSPTGRPTGPILFIGRAVKLT